MNPTRALLQQSPCHSLLLQFHNQRDYIRHLHGSCGSPRRAAKPLPVQAKHASEATKVVLNAREATVENFKPFGQLITAMPDGKQFDANDAQLVLDQGGSPPRFYIMQLPHRGLQFDRITFHSKVTQCLGSFAPDPWYLVVAAPTGSVDKPPNESDLHAFRVAYGTFVKLHQATWHAGPLFEGLDQMSFFNLELADTNVVDHNTHVWEDETFEVRERSGERLRWWTEALREQ